MNDQDKTKEQLINKLTELRQRVAELEKSNKECKRAAEAFRKREMRYHDLIESVEDWIWEVDNNGLYTFASHRVKDILGYDPEDLIGKTPFDLMPFEEAERLANIVSGMMREQKPIVSLENTNIHKNGKFVVLETSGNPFFDLEGKLLGYRGIDRDISERKKLQHLISQGEREWEETFDSMNDAITVHDREFTVIRANKAAEKILGLPLVKILGQKCYQLYHGCASPPHDCVSCQVVKTGIFSSIEKFETHLNRFIEIKAFPLFDQDTQIIKVVHVIRDITEQKQAEKLLRESEERFRRIFDDGPLGMALLSPSYKIINANKAVSRMMGYSEQEIAGRSMEDVTHPEDKEKSMKLVGQLLSGEIPFFQMEKRCIKKDGDILWTTITTTALRNQDGEVLYAICMIEDISNRKLAEEQREKLISELLKALAEIKRLQGILPICASCKKIRDDKGYWNQIETYIREHSEAEFTHGICPDCARKLYPEYYEE